MTATIRASRVKLGLTIATTAALDGLPYPRRINLHEYADPELRPIAVLALDTAADLGAWAALLGSEQIERVLWIAPSGGTQWVSTAYARFLGWSIHLEATEGADVAATPPEVDLRDCHPDDALAAEADAWVATVTGTPAATS